MLMDTDDLGDDLHNDTMNRSPRSSSGTSSSITAGDAIRRAGTSLSFSDVRFLSRLGSGDIGSVLLAELKSVEGVYFAAKVMEKKELVARNKIRRVKTEQEILQMTGGHPFLPTLYAALESPDYICLLTELCTGGELHALRQRQPYKRFDVSAVRFYASEVIVALEYLHMQGVIYRDLKPENVLIRSDGHIMVTDFDLSLRCDDASTSIPKTQIISNPPTSCVLPSFIVPAVTCFHSNRHQRKQQQTQTRGPGRPEFVVEPDEVRSMSIVGTHEYLAPEIVSGKGHGIAVDWWTFGVLIFELFYGVTPFKGASHKVTLGNIVTRALEFPKEPSLPDSAKDLIARLLVKDPARRLGTRMGASAIKRHDFFRGVNWALLRCMKPPFVPPPFSGEVLSSDSSSCNNTPVDCY